MTELESILRGRPAYDLVPRALVICSGGPVALAYSGLPEPIARIAEQLDGLYFAKRNPGATWTKTTFAAPRRPLSRPELGAVQQACRDANLEIEDVGERVRIEEISFVYFACSSLERIFHRHDYPLGPIDTSAPLDTKLADRASDVISQTLGDLDSYWPDFSRKPSTIDKYRRSSPEATLVSFLPKVPAAIRGMRERLRGMDLYDFFADESLHTTYRGLTPSG